MTALAISDNGRVLIPAARLHAEVRDGRLALTPASRRYANATRRYAPILTATCLLSKGAERRAEAEAAHEASGGQPGT